MGRTRWSPIPVPPGCHYTKRCHECNQPFADHDAILMYPDERLTEVHSRCYVPYDRMMKYVPKKDLERIQELWHLREMRAEALSEHMKWVRSHRQSVRK